ncbi:carbon storage regulator [Botrimarina hoheduenensis]|uniref:Translational regulator CsrA n=1 Tax=Botrimarina hoheduenensis TaxID=2528000 RepID=A0A5C5WE98_9BACT|nr:carbon storage regulator [Botrimarina hoheduenensis]TWT48797.1 hypothetical protein Pla111_05720 [Botrimarina hoheduenensis]
MLVLSRKAGQAITIGDDITIEVRRVAGNRVTLALQAPAEKRILRGELKEIVESFDGAANAEPAPSAELKPTIEFLATLAIA